MFVTEQFREIDALKGTGKTEAALNLLRKLVADHPNSAEGRARLGALLLETRQQQEACLILSEAVCLAPGDALAWCLYAQALQQCGELEKAAEAYRQAIVLSPQSVRAYNNLGLVLEEQGRSEAAVKVFEAVLVIEPGYASALNNLGAVLARGGKDEAASEAFARAAHADPSSVEARLNFGWAQLRLGCVAQSRAAFESVLRLHPSVPAALLGLASISARDGNIEQAMTVLQQGWAAGCDDPEVLLELAHLMAEANGTEPARALYTKVHCQSPNDLRAALGMHLTLPRVYGTGGEIEVARERYKRGLQVLASDVDACALPPPSELLRQLSWVNFYLAYQGRDDRELQSRYGAWLTRVLERGVPELMRNRQGRPDSRIRLGFASSLFQRGTVSSYFASWLFNLDALHFEVHLYDAGDIEDDTSRQLAAGCAHRRRVSLSNRAGALRLAQTIAADELDVLIYPELGMTPALFPVAALRLAQVQCVAWGHPVTTGLPNIDYFFSCAEMEPENAQQHYGERLLPLPGLGTAYPRPTIPAAGNRKDLGLPEGRNLYLFPHASFKIHPDNDQVMMDIAAADARATFVLVRGGSAPVVKEVLKRIERAFAARGVPSEGRFIVLPFLAHRDYLRLNLLCDVLVDCIHWSGGSTSLDALACGLPVVTQAGASMRSRQSTAFLRFLGMEELVASSSGELARSAVRLANDKVERGAISARILAQSHLLFGRSDFVPVFQSLLEKISNKTIDRRLV